MATTVLHGGSGQIPDGGKVLINISDRSYEVHYGYSTVANGYASAIDCPAGGYAIKLDGGSPRDFASWLIADDFSEIEKHMQEYPRQFHFLSVLFPGCAKPESIVHGNYALQALHVEDWKDYAAQVRQAIKLYEV